jgi:hypothetical protein
MIAKIFGSTFLISSLLLSSVAFSKSIKFELKAFPTKSSSVAEIKAGLLDLYKKIPDKKLESQIAKASEFQSLVYDTLDQKILTNKILTADVQEKILTGNFVKETTIRFPSLIQRPGHHASNMVVARIYEPSITRKSCDYKFPTTIMLHHILNEVDMIEDVAKVMSAGVLSQAGIVVVIHMPHYGERRQGNEEFLNSDLASFRKNMAQLILDVHSLRNFLETRKNVNSENISLSGISLGAVMGITVGAFDQGFARFGNLVGGVDMANILMNRVRTRADSEVAVALKDTALTEPALRDELAAVDGMTWLHRYQSKKLFFLSAIKDDIINFDISVIPMIAKLKQQNNEIEQKINNDTHSPSGNALKKLNEVFMPLLKFMIGKAPTYESVCKNTFNSPR